MTSAAAPRRVGLFGGSFDPVHRAHVALARSALAALLLDEVRWLPAGRPWQKAARAMTPAHHRVAMVELAIAAEPRFVCDRIEVDRPGPTYTIDTLLELRRREPGVDWVLLLGEDQFARLHTWRGWRELAAIATFAVAARPHAAAAASSTPPPPARVAHERVPLPPMDVSATRIRERVARGLPIAGLVPPQVARYIESEHLYRS